MQIAIVDDEKAFRDAAAQKIKMLAPEAELLFYQSGDALLLAGTQPDILFLDIQMPGKNGMETAREFRRKNKTAVLIFVTVLEDYVFQAFDVGAFHYLVKPYEDEKLAEVCKKAIEQCEDQRKRESAAEKEKTAKLVVMTGGRHVAVSFEDIVYAEVFDRKIVIHTMDEDIEYYGKMKELERKAGENFYRPHRAYLVNLAFVRKYDAATIYLEKGRVLMAKKQYREFVRCYLKYIQRKGRADDRK